MYFYEGRDYKADENALSKLKDEALMQASAAKVYDSLVIFVYLLLC